MVCDFLVRYLTNSNGVVYLIVVDFVRALAVSLRACLANSAVQKAANSFLNVGSKMIESLFDRI